MPIEFQADVFVDHVPLVETKVDFEWDEAKRLGNLEERGVDFRDAALIFQGTVRSFSRVPLL